MIKAHIKNPFNGKYGWFSFPLYFGKLYSIGILDYDQVFYVVEIEGTDEFFPGDYTLSDLDLLNRIAGGDLA